MEDNVEDNMEDEDSSKDTRYGTTPNWLFILLSKIHLISISQLTVWQLIVCGNSVAVQKQWQGSSGGCAQCNSIRGKKEYTSHKREAQAASSAGNAGSSHGRSSGSMLQYLFWPGDIIRFLTITKQSMVMMGKQSVQGQ